jgi:hypothetical protein
MKKYSKEELAKFSEDIFRQTQKFLEVWNPMESPFKGKCVTEEWKCGGDTHYISKITIPEPKLKAKGWKRWVDVGKSETKKWRRRP